MDNKIYKIRMLLDNRRFDLALTKTETAKVIGISIVTYLKIEKGISAGLRSLKKVADYLGLTMPELREVMKTPISDEEKKAFNY